MLRDPTRESFFKSGPKGLYGRMGPEMRRYLLEWVGTGCLGVVIVFLCVLGQMTATLDREAYDRLLALDQRPLVPEIAIVEIDDASIAQWGRWPWPRDRQASLIRAVRQAGAAAIVYDVLLNEPGKADAELADALRSVPAYLPMALVQAEDEGLGMALRPAEVFARAAAGIGHIDLQADSDGIVRSVAFELRDSNARWPYIDVPLFDAIRSGAVPLADGRYAARGRSDHAVFSPGTSGGRVPFGANVDERSRLSAGQLLRGQFASEALRGKVVFVGVTATGIYGHVSTPVSGRFGPVPDVFVHAEVLSALLSDRFIYSAAPGWAVTAWLLELTVLLAGFFVLSPWRTLLLTVGLWVASLSTSALLLHGASIWLSPVPALIGLVVLYPMWMWRRLEMTMSRLRLELKRLDSEAHLLPEAPVPVQTFRGDALERQIAQVERAARRLQDMKRFVWDSLNCVPEPVLLADRYGVILFANKAALARIVRLGNPDPRGRTLTEALGSFSLVKTIDTEAEAAADIHGHWPAILDPRGEHVGVVKRGLEVRDTTGRDYLLRYARCRNEQNVESGSWVAGLVEITELRAAERMREDALRLLSHDMRSRHASILALVELERSNTESERTIVLLERIERHARRALKLADDFVQLARAESQAYVLEPANFADVVIDASDEIWPQARAKAVRVDVHAGGGEYWIAADRSLMTRAVANVINNAVKYSPSDTQVTIEVVADGAHRVKCVVSDQGYGISKDMQKHLFEPFRRFYAPRQPSTSGAGLGMAFIKAVVIRHGGEVRVDSEPGKGTVVTIWLPALESVESE